jgi:hypothetical protein
MPIDLPAEQRTRTVRAFLKLCVASSILQSALVLSVYRFQISGPLLYLLALIAISPLCAALLGALRKRAAETDPYVRKTYVRGMIPAGLMIVMTPLLILVTLFFSRTFASAVLTSALPLVLGALFTGFLLIPNRMMDDGNLGDSLLPLRSKLVTPTLRRLLRISVLYFVYIALNLNSVLLFGANDPPAGILAYVIALLPVLPLFGLIPIYNKYMSEEQDEFQRHIFQQSILGAFLGTLIIASVMGRLQDHALIFHRRPDFFRPYSVFPVFWWLQFEAGFIVNAVQAFRVHRQEKKDKQEKQDQ